MHCSLIPTPPHLQFLIAPFLHIASDQKLEAGEAWERGYSALYSGTEMPVLRTVQFQMLL